MNVCFTIISPNTTGISPNTTGEAAKLPFPVRVHMLRHSTHALAGRGMDTRRLQHYLHASMTNTVRYTAMSPEPFKDIWR